MSIDKVFTMQDGLRPAGWINTTDDIYPYNTYIHGSKSYFKVNHEFLLNFEQLVLVCCLGTVTLARKRGTGAIKEGSFSLCT